MKVLVVDDNAPLAENLAEMLGNEGHDVSFVTDPQDALHHDECFDAYVLDVCMPGMDGWQLRAQLQDRCPSAQIVLMTGFADRSLRPAGELLMPLEKPVPFQTLLEKLAS